MQTHNAGFPRILMSPEIPEGTKTQVIIKRGDSYGDNGWMVGITK